MFNREILAAIEAYDTIIIHRHVSPDPDAIGSQIGLRDCLRATYPEKKVYAVGFDEPSLREIGRMDEVTDDMYNGALVIVNDTADTPRIDDKRYTLGDKLLKIDHHPNLDPYGDELFVDTKASSVSEIWASVILDDSNNLKMSDSGASAFFMGMVGDTGRFLFDNTTPKTLHTAAELLKYDFNASDQMQRANTQSEAEAKLQGYSLTHMNIVADGAANYVIVPQTVLEELDIKAEEAHSIVQLPGSITGVKAWITFVELPDGQYRCHLRSKVPAINGIAERHNGGGHEKASGATAKDRAEIDQMVKELEEAVKD
ncbi:MAG: bifunctional oligoribonuclease/PAP phosphatase NrnA [Aerococcus sp.]|nr:bifunctional oligoribonuclease/PAP phosphatase NrnA [Aerococcus sp.]